MWDGLGRAPVNCAVNIRKTMKSNGDATKNRGVRFTFGLGLSTSGVTVLGTGASNMDGTLAGMDVGGTTTADNTGGWATWTTGEGGRMGRSIERRRLGPRRMTPSSTDEEARPKRTSVRFSLERGEGEGAYERERSMGGGLLTTPSSMSRSRE